MRQIIKKEMSAFGILQLTIYFAYGYGKLIFRETE